MANNDTLGGLHYEMMKRCYNPKSIMFQNYGAKGIEVCPEWHDRGAFKKWALDNGFKKGLRLKRINPSLGYSPDNCCFSEKTIQQVKPRKELPAYLKAKAEKEDRDRVRESFGVPKKFSSLPIYKIYRGMVRRSSGKPINGTSGKFLKKYYIDKNIGLCDEWKGRIGFYRFYAWSIKNGYRRELSIDRIDNSMGYSPDNCRWVTMKAQERNKDNNVRYDYHGKKLLLIEICEKENISYDALKYRVTKRGQDIDYAISEIRKNKARKDQLNDPFHNPIGCKIKMLRAKTGLTQAEFSEKYNIRIDIIRKWERGCSVPNEDLLKQIEKSISDEYGISNI